MLNILSLDQKEKWNEIIRSMYQYDFYHLAEYHKLDKSGKSLLLCFSSQATTFAFPVIVRPIAETGYYDITSVYGYAGPLSNQKNPDIQTVKEFQKELLHFFDSNKIVSAFARLHPFFTNQDFFLSDFGKVLDTNQTVGINLKAPESEQKRQYSHSVKNHINRLKRRNIIVKKAENREEIDIFVEIYRENMKRVNASQIYFFSNDYFYWFIENLPSTLFLAYYKGKAISGSLFTSCNGIVQPHLSATLDEYLRWSPLKLVWNCIRLYSIEKQEELMHLGGGLSGTDDSLFEFKAQFSDMRFMFKTWRYIHNKDVYNSLAAEKFPNNIPDSSFFPLYRLDLSTKGS